MAEQQILLHRRSSQVEHAILEAHRLGNVFVVELERRRERRVEDLELVREDFDLARWEFRVDGAFGPRAHEPARRHYEFVAQLLGDAEGCGAVRVADDLDESFAVAQVDEDDTPVIAAAMDPAADGDDLAEALTIDAAAVPVSRPEADIRN